MLNSWRRQIFIAFNRLLRLYFGYKILLIWYLRFIMYAIFFIPVEITYDWVFAFWFIVWFHSTFFFFVRFNLFKFSDFFVLHLLLYKQFNFRLCKKGSFKYFFYKQAFLDLLRIVIRLVEMDQLWFKFEILFTFHGWILSVLVVFYTVHVEVFTLL